MSSVDSMKQTRKHRSLVNRIGAGAIVYSVLHWGTQDVNAAQLPMPCFAGNCGANANTFVTLGSATAVQAGNTLTVQQTSAKATLNWASFNIAPGGAVVFKQPTSTSIALNRIWDANPSSIFGSLTANGQVYLINANGFLFGSGKAGDPMATVNVAGLIASPLHLSDSTFKSGIL